MFKISGSYQFDDFTTEVNVYDDSGISSSIETDSLVITSEGAMSLVLFEEFPDSLKNYLTRYKDINRNERVDHDRSSFYELLYSMKCLEKRGDHYFVRLDHLVADIANNTKEPIETVVKFCSLVCNRFDITLCSINLNSKDDYYAIRALPSKPVALYLTVNSNKIANDKSGMGSVLSDIVVNSLQDLSELKLFQIEGNNYIDKTSISVLPLIEKLQSAPNLTHLGLQNCDISGANVVSKFPALRYVNLINSGYKALDKYGAYRPQSMPGKPEDLKPFISAETLDLTGFEIGEQRGLAILDWPAQGRMLRSLTEVLTASHSRIKHLHMPPLTLGSGVALIQYLASKKMGLETLIPHTVTGNGKWDEVNNNQVLRVRKKEFPNIRS